MATLGSAWISVQPEGRDFGVDTKRVIDAATRGMNAPIPVTPDGRTFRPDVQKILDAGTRAMKGTVPIGADTEPMTRGLAAAQARLDAASRKAYNFRLDADSAGLQAKITDARTRLAAVAGRVYSARISADDKEAELAITNMKAQLGALGRRLDRPKIQLDGVDRALAGILSVDLALDKLDAKDARPKVDARDLSAGLNAVTGSLGNVSTGFAALIAVGVILSPVLVTVGAGLAGLGAAAKDFIGPVLAAGTATAQQQAALQGLDSAQHDAYDSLAYFKAELASFSKALEPQLLDAFAQGLAAAQLTLADMAPVAKEVGDSLDYLLGEVNAEFMSGTWQQFFGFMAKTAAPDLKLLGVLFLQLLDDIPPLVEALQPLAVVLLQDAGSMARVLGYLAQLSLAASNSTTTLQTAADGTQRLASSHNLLGDAVHNAWHQLTGQLIPGLDKTAPSVKGLWDKLTGASGAAKDFATSTQDARDATAAAVPPTGLMADNLYVESVNAGLAGDAVTTLNSAWAAFLGLSSGLESAQLAVEAGLKTLSTDAKAAGASFTGTNDASQALQTAFESGLLPSTENVIGGMRQAHASAHDLAVVVATDLKPAVDAGALSNQAFRTQLYDLAVQAGYTGPNQLQSLKKWFDANASSTDAAKSAVDKFAGALAGLPSSVAVKVRMTGDGTYSITGPGQAAPYRVKAAASGLYLHPNEGVPGQDSVLVRAMPGELIVPTNLVPQVAPVLGGKIPGFAAGGTVDTTGWKLTPPFVTGMYADFEQHFTAAMTTAMRAGITAAQQAAQAMAALSYLPLGAQGPLSASAATAQAFARSIMFAYGWRQDQFPPLQALWNQESGWNAYARNPSSGASGIPQNINGWSAYAPGDYQAQIRWGLAYISSRYGSPANAWAHEIAYNWYAGGGLIPGHAAGGPVAGGIPTFANPAEAAWLKRFTAAQKAEYGDWAALWHGFLGGPARYRDRATLSQLRALEKREWAEQVAFSAITSGGLTPQRATAFRAAAISEYNMAGGDRLLARLHGGHPAAVAGLRAELAVLAALAKNPPAGSIAAAPNVHQIPGEAAAALALGPAHTVPGGVLTFDAGGTLPPGLSLAWNGTGAGETVTPGGGGVHLHLTVNGPVGSQQELETWFVHTANLLARTGRLSQAVRTAGR